MKRKEGPSIGRMGVVAKGRGRFEGKGVVASFSFRFSRQFTCFRCYIFSILEYGFQCDGNIVQLRVSETEVSLRQTQLTR